jgi:FMN-dependent NADH-azoreductase
MMARLLYVECSPRKTASASIEVSRAFLDAYAAAHPGDAVETYDIWAKDLPPFGEDALDAKYAGLYGTGRTPEQEAAWSQMQALAAPFLAADKLLFAVPMWNFSIPYRLKQLIDLISQKDILFSFDESGFKGLLKARRAAVVCARGVDYSPSSAWTPGESYDFQKPYMKAWLQFIGVAEVDSIVIERTLFGREADRDARAVATAAAVELAHRF